MSNFIVCVTIRDLIQHIYKEEWNCARRTTQVTRWVFSFGSRRCSRCKRRSRCGRWSKCKGGARLRPPRPRTARPPSKRPPPPRRRPAPASRGRWWCVESWPYRGLTTRSHTPFGMTIVYLNLIFEDVKNVDSETSIGQYSYCTNRGRPQGSK